MKYWLLLSLLLVVHAKSAEVDQFTDVTPLQDSSAVLAKEVNRRIQVAVYKANSFYPRVLQPKKSHHRRRPQCDVERLYGQLQYQLARPLIGQLESFAEQSEQVAKRWVTFPRSIYQNYQQKEAPTLVLSERIAAVINVNGVDIGADKLGHFFTEGRTYFEITDRLKDGVHAGVAFGDWSESLYFGAQTTGVFSYADLTANFNGLRFWNRLLANQKDPLTQKNITPYIHCENKRWVVVEPFNFSDYVDNGWNEAVNCSAFRTEQLLQKVLSHHPRCETDKLPIRYGALSKNILNSQGLKVLPEALQPEVILARRADEYTWQLPEEMIERIRKVRLDLERWRSDNK